ncbi:MAG TPA: CDP-alcohol phosphatidyltransferase family protein, partial [Anaerolineales bacterium]|nr:CDP-alcohol phosphatidyltransferase family protein [Anaerolineales bacterium]
MELSTPYPSQSFFRLKLLWLRFGLISLVFLGAGTLALQVAWETRFALRWLALASPALVYLIVVFRIGLHYNHRPEEVDLLPTLGAGNWMSLGRGVLLAALVGFLFVPKPSGWLAWIPGVLYTLACAADFLDGYLARRTNHVTRLGEFLDMSFDGVGVFAAATLAVQYGQAPVWYLIIAAARYLFLFGLRLLKTLGKPVLPLHPSLMRRVFAGLQMGFLAVILWPIMVPPASLFAATLFGIPFLFGFGQDWLVVSGLIKPRSGAGKLIAPFSTWISSSLPVVLRGAVLALLVWISIQQFQQATLPVWLIALEWTAAIFVIFGTAGRIFATAGLILLGIGQIYTPVMLEQYSLAVLYTGLLFLGTGKYSLWAPEDQAVIGQAGKRHKPSEREQEA